MRLLLTTVAALVGLAAFAGQAAACSCVADYERLYKSADAAINARLIEVRPLGTEPSSEADFRYRVGRRYKGPRRLRQGRVVTVRSRLDEATCGMPDDVGRVYGLLLWRKGSKWESSLCGVVPRGKLKRVAAGNAAGAGGCSG